MLKSGKFIEEDMRAYDVFWGKMKVELEKKSMMGKGKRGCYSAQWIGDSRWPRQRVGRMDEGSGRRGGRKRRED